MADEALSALSTTFQNGYSTSDVMLLLDVTDTTMASTGTDKGITVATLLAEYVHAGSNITITAGSTGVTIASTASGGGSGSVTSVGFTGDGTVLSSTESGPVTTSGVLAATLSTQTPNYLLAGPASGSTHLAPTFRALVAADLPSGTGTVTSVAATVPSWLSVSGSPITSSGTLAVTAAGSQTANEVLATPNGSNGALSVRALVAADLPASVVLTTGSYSQPTWLTSILGSIVSGNISGNAASITGSVTTSQISNLSSWTGSTAITTLGTIATGTVPQANVSGLVSALALLAPLASPTFSGAVVETPVAVTATGGAATLSWSAGSWFVVTLASGVNTITLSNVPAGTSKQRVIVELIQPSGTAATVTWSGPTLSWGGAGVPTLSSTAGYVDVITLINVTTSEVRAAANLGFTF
jgi:hypothetical protein